MRRRAQSDDRRRRMLVEESPHELPEKRASRRRGSAAASYAPDTLGQQPQCVDFLPRRMWVHPLLWFVSLCGVIGLIALDQWQQTRTDGPWEIFQLQHPASLATWSAAIGLLVVAVLSLNIFSLRRHRKSDYHTRYRWWIWVSATAMLSSVAVVTGWPEVASRAVAAVSEWNLPWGNQLIWLVPVGLLYTFLALRLVLEFRGCRLAIFAVGIAWLGFGFHSGMRLGFDPGISAASRGTLEGGTVIGMVACLCCGLLWYARHVLLDIEGRLPVRKPKANSAAPAKGEDSDKRRSAKTSAPRGPSDLEPEASRRVAELIEETDFDEHDPDDAPPTKRKRQESRKQSAHADIDMDCEEMPEHRRHEQQKKLSKAQRKKLRKLKAKERHAA